MTTAFSDLPDWTFEVREVSAGMFEVCGRYSGGGIIRKAGIDPDALLEQCRIEAHAALTLARQTERSCGLVLQGNRLSGQVPDSRRGEMLTDENPESS